MAAEQKYESLLPKDKTCMTHPVSLNSIEEERRQSKRDDRDRLGRRRAASLG